MSRHLDETLLPAPDLQASPRMPRWLALVLAGAILAGVFYGVRERVHQPLPAGKGHAPAPKAVQPGH